MDPAITELITVLLPVVLPLLGVSGYAGHKAIQSGKLNINQRYENDMVKYKYDMMVKFVKTVSVCMEDDKITPAEMKIIGAQLKNILGDVEGNEFGRNSIKGGMLGNV